MQATDGVPVPTGNPSGVALNTLEGVPDTVDDGVVNGDPHPGALAWSLDQAGCEGATYRTEVPFPTGASGLTATFALTDSTPLDANVHVSVSSAGSDAAGSVTLGRGQRTAFLDVAGISGGMALELEVLSSFGAQCRDVPVTVLAFDSVVQ